jgi:homocitrate synthase NifV
MKHVEIIDSTLREGRQAPGVMFSPAAELAVIAGLRRVGVAEIELGVASPLHDWLPNLVRAARKIVRHSCRLALWCRCREEDIAFAAACRPDVLSLSMPVSDCHIKERLGKDRAWVLDRLACSVRQALALGIPFISVGLEDASRADSAFVIEAAKIAAQNSAGRIRLADTVGICSPGTMAALVKTVKKTLRIKTGVHCHNDFGMATANSIAALEAGADCLDAAVLGLGERTGCCRLEEAVGYLALVLEQRHYQTEDLPALCRCVAEAAGRTIPASHPLVGKEIFTCETGLHQHGLAVNPATYEPYPPERVKSGRTLRFGGKTGRKAVLLHLQKLGVQLDESKVEQLVCQLRTGGSVLSEQQLLGLAMQGC